MALVAIFLLWCTGLAVWRHNVPLLVVLAFFWLCWLVTAAEQGYFPFGWRR